MRNTKRSESEGKASLLGEVPLRKKPSGQPTKIGPEGVSGKPPKKRRSSEKRSKLTNS